MLGDEKKRSAYDNPAQHNPFAGFPGFGGHPGGGNPHFGFGSEQQPHNPFAEFFQFSYESTGDFGDFFNQQTRQDPRRHQEELNITIQQTVPLRTIYNDEPIVVEFNRNVPCSSCDGAGTEAGDAKQSVECLYCEGKGRMRNGGFGQPQLCNHCHGSGTLHTKTCGKCQGTKVFAKKESISIDNSFALAPQGQQIRQHGHGHFSSQQRGRRGDLCITLVTEQPERYERQGDDLLHELRVDFVDAILGAAIEYEHVDGRKLKINIPAQTNNRHKMKLTGLGMLKGDKRSRGNLLLTVNLHVNYETLDMEKIKALR